MTPKIERETMCSSFEEGAPKNVDINFKIASLQCSSIKPLHDDKFHLIKPIFGINFKFYSNLDFNDLKFVTVYSFYKQLSRNWCNYLSFFFYH